MLRKLSLHTTFRLFVLAGALAMSTTSLHAAGPYVQIMHQFGLSSEDGTFPDGLITDGAGNLYGTTYDGGTGYGTVFRFSPPPKPGGAWTETILVSFDGSSNGPDGAFPFGGLALDAKGNLYGITLAGGTGGQGSVYEVTHNPDGSWTKTILYSFTGGSSADGRLVLDAAGNIYGATTYGGSTSCALGCGVVFKLTPDGNGGWSERVIHKFQNDSDGWNPVWLTIHVGKLYGVTNSTIFELARANGSWHLSTIHTFSGSFDGTTATSPLLFDTAGNAYGTDGDGGIFNEGEVFEVSPPTGEGSTWSKSSLYAFVGGADGSHAFGLIRGKNGTLIGLTGGGTGCFPVGGCGTVFQMVNSGGTWAKNTLYLFKGSLELPEEITPSPAGWLFGISQSNNNAWGTLFRLYGF
jgi:uncharacterized repeat protein (TIGR03803 family)